MGRANKQLDPNELYELLESGVPAKHIAKELGVSVPTLSKRITDLQQRQGLLMQYRSIHALHLTSLQAQILEAISPDKIEEASLKDLVLCYKVLKDKELVTDGKPSEIKGLVSYLVHLEKEQIAAEQCVNVTPEKYDDAEFSEDLEEAMPNL